ncbi:ABC transporter ATP-binding protein [Pasteurellaceae bacterium USgator11]|nr:ABC transporter ATP-binding protein [Pasteurellaceae bacterium UScroc12]TNG96347.1 ABC transporter ATP-binding protein [Pasteurellaceae bacterium UScroc31]TNG98028.1 ABC transporter ATP-binding protein [Pasteurellaceae bacterium USgator41]TNH02310.1 ABC transporter ATP-binding protein [Pasteurellaceae bacterium USgator11]
MNAVEIRSLTLAFEQQALFTDFNFDLPQQQWTVLLGRSGVGKSTLLRAIAGLENTAIQQGNIHFPHPLKLAWLAQQDSLYPWLSLLDNVQLEQHLKGKKTRQSRQQAEHLLAAVQMENHLHKGCQQLSGGQRQRVALARTLMQNADLILMDEPFSALDAVTRLQLQDLACDLLQHKTVLLITHDPQEAIRVGDRIYVLHDPRRPLNPAHLPEGKKPRDLTENPQSALQQMLFHQLLQGAPHELV